jgi:HK97 family phage prohead protease
MEKSIGVALELKDLDTSKRTAVIKHAVYTSVDKVKDISVKGMFTKSWKENTPDFLFNHVTGSTVGSVKRTFDDDEGAYTEVKFGNWTLGNDVLEMASEGVLKGASYGYETEKKEYVQIKGQRVRKLKEVKHIETSLLTVLPAHPGAGIISLTKSFETKKLTESEQSFLRSLLSNDISNLQSLISIAGTIDTNSDLYTWIMYQISRRADWSDSIMSKLYWDAQSMKSIKSDVAVIETYCRKANASDETIIMLQNSVDEYKQLISDYDTANTPLATEPVASDEEMSIKSFLTSLNIETWKKQSLSN